MHSPKYHCHQLLVSKELGGAGLVALHLAAGLDEKGRSSHVWVPGEGPATSKARDLGLSYRIYEPDKAFVSSRVQSLLWNWKVGRSLRHDCPGIIHVHSPFFYGALSFAIRISRLKSVAHVHLKDEKQGLQWAFKNPPDVIITCARFLENYVRSVLPAPMQARQRIVAVSNAVDVERFYPGNKTAMRDKLGLSNNMPVVIMVANLAPHKGQETAIRAAALLKSNSISAQFCFAGSQRQGTQDYCKRLQSFAQELGVADRVRFLGQRDDVPDLLRAVDVLLLPSTAEGLPLSILEAQASKVAVVAAPTAGIPEIIEDGATGFLVNANDAAGYARRLYDLFRVPNIYSRITEAAYLNVLQRHGWRSYIDRISDIYQTLNDN